MEKLSKEAYNNDIDSKDFFGKKVNLTVSGQLEAEAMACSFGKVYTFGPSIFPAPSQLLPVIIGVLI